MFPDYAKFHEFERRLIASEPADFAANLRLADAIVRARPQAGPVPRPRMPARGRSKCNIRLSRILRSVHGNP